MADEGWPSFICGPSLIIREWKPSKVMRPSIDQA